MSYDSNGNHTLPAGYKAVTGQKVLPSNHNPPLEDISASLSQVVIADGRKPMTGPLNMNGNPIIGLEDGVNPTDAATVGQAALSIGDGKWSINDLGEKWLRRDGGLYDVVDYPELAAILPPLPDGVQWTTPSVGQTGLKSIVAKPGGGFLIGREYNPSAGVFATDIFSTLDGVSYTLVATIPNFSLVDLAYGGGVYMAADGNGKVATSNDSINWSVTASTIAGGTAAFTMSVAFGAGLFVAATGNSAGYYIHSSPDGVTWTQRYSNGASSVLNRVRFANATFIAVGATGTLATSTNGTAWTARTTGTTQALYSATFGNGVYVVVGNGGVILTSANLTAWTARASGTTQALNDALFSTSGFLVVGNAGVARISGASDGITWAATPTGSSINLTDAAYDLSVQNRYVVIQLNSTSALRGTRTLPTQFQVPDDGGNEWIKASA